MGPAIAAFGRLVCVSEGMVQLDISIEFGDSKQGDQQEHPNRGLNVFVDLQGPRRAVEAHPEKSAMRNANSRANQ